jgi:heptosyltransferase III
MSAGAPHLLVIRRRYLGDIVLLGSVFRNLKLHWPSARIAVLCEASYADILKLNADVAEVFHFPRKFTDWPRLALALRRARFSHVLDLDNRDKTAVLTLATGAPVRVTQRHTERVHLPSFYTRSEVLPTEFLHERHITDLYLHLLGAVGVPVQTRETRLTPRREDVAAAQRALDAAGSRIPARAAKILVHPGSRSAWRVWPPENFARVIDALAERHDCGSVLVSGPGERGTVDAICAATKHAPARLDEPLPLPQLAALFSLFPVMLCHDSGPMHVATAVGTRVVALYGSQTLSHWRPLGDGHVTLQPPLPCVNCVSPGQCHPDDAYHNHCVRNITVDRVVDAVAAKLRS